MCYRRTRRCMRLSRALPMRAFMFPRIDEEAVEATERGEEDRRWDQRNAQHKRTPGNGGYKDCGGEEQSDRNLLRQPVRAVRGMEDDKPCDQQRAFDEIKTYRSWIERGQHHNKRRGGEYDPRQKSAAMAVVKEMPLLEFVQLRSPDGVECPAIEQPVARVKDPDRERHRRRRNKRQVDTTRARNEPGP